ncbi:unnamed protein product [Rotaria magnacalcarata]
MGCQSFAWWVVGISAVLFVVGIIVGSMLASAYVENSQERKLYTNTNCLLVNYSSASHTCESCIRDYCFNYQCFDEIFYVSYFIFNGTLVNSTFAIYGKDTQHKQTQIGAYYPCFYATKQVTSMIWDLPDEKLDFILLCVFFGIAAFSLIFIIFFACCLWKYQ